ncbi:MAG: AGE family epimerase/isomerase [Flavobacteriales bacterium]|nr:AGE family epimerase/isomerase [Flavobacteriales bacterium]
MDKRIIKLKNEVENTLHSNILRYWMEKMVDDENGGFYGQITGEDRLVPHANKGAILNARILWSFSSAYRITGRSEYLTNATRAKDYIISHFYDTTYGGIYWEVDCKSRPVDTKKQIYALGFAIYGLSEYARATGEEQSLSFAKKLFDVIEKHSFDSEKNGYLEALTRQWLPIEDMRLSEKDANEKKTMNTHLHILEPYTNLYRVWKDQHLKTQLKNLIEVFLEKILDQKTGHLNLFFDENWDNKYHMFSYGHDIEASWLLHEAALVLDDKDILKRVEEVVPLIEKAASEGLQEDGSMIYEKNFTTAHTDTDRHWWVQAETVVGYINMYQHFGSEDSLEKALKNWEYIKTHLIDHEKGEWHWSCHQDGTVNTTDDKAGFWKCPYHNSRMCLEIMERFK